MILRQFMLNSSLFAHVLPTCMQLSFQHVFVLCSMYIYSSIIALILLWQVFDSNWWLNLISKIKLCVLINQLDWWLYFLWLLLFITTVLLLSRRRCLNRWSWLRCILIPRWLKQFIYSLYEQGQNSITFCVTTSLWWLVFTCTLFTFD